MNDVSYLISAYFYMPYLQVRGKFVSKKYLSGFLISSVTKLRVSQPEYEKRAEYNAKAISPGSRDEPWKESSKFIVKPV